MEQIYELAYLLSINTSEETLNEIAGKIQTILKTEKAKIIKLEKPRKIHLSYPIQEQEGAFLMSHRFQTEQGKITNLKQSIDKMPEIIRLLIVKRQPFRPEQPREKPIGKEKPKAEIEVGDIEKELDEVLK